MAHDSCLCMIPPSSAFEVDVTSPFHSLTPRRGVFDFESPDVAEPPVFVFPCACKRPVLRHERAIQMDDVCMYIRICAIRSDRNAHCSYFFGYCSCFGWLHCTTAF